MDDPVAASLNGFHAHLAEKAGRVQRYPADVSPFMAVPADPTSQDWANALALIGAGHAIVFAPSPLTPSIPAVSQSLGLVQMVARDVAGALDPEVEQLTYADVPEILALTALTKPGPFLDRTIELGNYYGLRAEGQLVAMAGERMRAPGWTEISAICTAPEHRGKGLSVRLIRTLVHHINARGEQVFLHAVETNPAIGLYESLGFEVRRRLVGISLSAPT
ncbi:GNAT family N-acetyltransferase [Williamsia soli]|uniref:GNAT family N-acetyltransferase n=1 Tax=Williamsia soli TaxID=364929 RepID=UPI001F00B74D|nr:GNAT family N-acetyltransferase [Williamsia soli]